MRNGTIEFSLGPRWKLNAKWITGFSLGPALEIKFGMDQ
eukprot:SAG22_NODE_2283_length_2758_cov_31.640090_3_plen_39_part_00